MMPLLNEDLVGDVRQLPPGAVRRFHAMLTRFAARSDASRLQLIQLPDKVQRAAMKAQADYWKNVSAGLRWTAHLMLQATGLEANDAEQQARERPVKSSPGRGKRRKSA